MASKRLDAPFFLGPSSQHHRTVAGEEKSKQCRRIGGSEQFLQHDENDDDVDRGPLGGARSILGSSMSCKGRSDGAAEYEVRAEVSHTVLPELGLGLYLRVLVVVLPVSRSNSMGKYSDTGSDRRNHPGAESRRPQARTFRAKGSKNVIALLASLAESVSSLLMLTRSLRDVIALRLLPTVG